MVVVAQLKLGPQLPLLAAVAALSLAAPLVAIVPVVVAVVPPHEVAILVPFAFPCLWWRFAQWLWLLADLLWRKMQLFPLECLEE